MFGSLDCQVKLSDLLARIILVYQEYIPASLAESSTFGSASLLQTEEQYERRVGKEWNEGKLREWELMHNGGEDWPGRADER